MRHRALRLAALNFGTCAFGLRGMVLRAGWRAGQQHLRPMAAVQLHQRCRTTVSSAVSSNNPVLHTTSSEFPLFDAIQPEHVVPGVDAVIDECEAKLDALEARITAKGTAPLSSSELISELDVLTDRLVISWGAVGHLKSVKDSPELRDAVQQVLPRRVAFGLRMGQSAPLYNR